MALTDQPADTPREQLVNGHLKGFDAVADKTKIIGYINLIYNEATPDELQTLTIPLLLEKTQFGQVIYSFGRNIVVKVSH